MRTLVEVGANDGFEQSKTAELIKRGWKALLIEPSSVYYDRLVDKYQNNELVDCHNVAIDAKEQDRDLYYVHPDDIKEKGLPSWVGLIGSFSIDHIKKHIFDPSVRIVKETVHCVPLNTSLEQNGVKDIDLLMVDVEGAELEVLGTFDWKKYSPRYVEVETKHLDKKQRKRLEGILSTEEYAICPMTDVFGNASIFAHKRSKVDSTKKPSGRKAVATIADKKFLPGLEVMVHSLLKHTEIDTEAWELVVLSNDLTEEDIKRVRKIWKKVSIRSFDTAKYASIDKAIKERMSGANGSYYKFELFGLEEFDRIVALDSDLLILQDVSELFDSTEQLAASKELLIDQYNTGVMIIGSYLIGKQTVDALIEATEIMGPREHADQDTINAYFWDRFAELSSAFNFLKTYYNYPFLHKFHFPPHIKILHYIIHKPWLWDGSMNEIEIGTEPLNQMWINEYGAIPKCDCDSCSCDKP